MVRADGATTTLTGVFNVNVTFSEDVTDFVAADVTVDQSATVAVVSGTTDAYVVSVTPATGTDATLAISIAGGIASDLAGNLNIAASESLQVPVDTDAPEVTFASTPPAITTANEASYALSGTCSENSRSVEILFASASKGTATCGSGTWSITLNLSSEADADDTVDIIARHTDAMGNSADVTSQGVIRDTTIPTVTITRTTGDATTPSKTASWTLSCNDTCQYKSKVIAADGACTAISSDWSSTTTVRKSDGNGDFNVCVQAKDDQGNIGAFVKDASQKANLDNTAPIISSIRRKVGEPTGTINSDLVFVVTFSEQVSGFDAADLSADNSATIGSVSCSGVSCEGTLIPSSNYNGTVTITVANTGFTDVAGNSVTGNNQTLPVAVDTVAPTISSILRKVGQPTGTINGDLIFVVTFSEQVRNFDVDDLSADNGGRIDSVNCSGVSCEGKLIPPSNYTGDVIITVASTGFEDVAGNSVMGDAKTLTVAVDIQAPTITIARGTGSKTVASKTASWTLTCDDTNGCKYKHAVITAGATCDSAALSGSWTSSLTTNAVTVSKNNGDGDFTVCAKVKDGQENEGGFVKGNSSLYAKLDNTAPTISSIIRKAGQPTGTINGDLIFVVTFSEEVKGFDAADLSTNNNNGTISSLVCVGVSCEGILTPPSTYTGDVTITVANTGFTDLAGNSISGDGDTKSLVVAVDTQAPTVTITRGTTGSATNAFKTASWNLSCDDSNGCDYKSAVIATDATCDANALSSDWAGSLTTSTMNILKSDGDGDFTVCVQVKDGQGNEGAFVKGGSSLYAKLDTTRPTMTLVRTDGATSTLTGSFDVTVTFSEDVTGFANADVSVSPSVTSKSVSGSGKAYKVTVDPAPGTNGNLSISIIADAVIDGARNGNLVSAVLSVPVDTDAPEVTFANTPPTITTLNEASYTLSGTCSENTRGVDIYIGGTSRKTITCASNAWSATLDLSSDADAEDTVTIFARHANAGGVSGDSTSFPVTRDTKKPTVTIARGSTGSATVASKTASWNLSCDDSKGCDYKSVVIATNATCDASALSSAWAGSLTTSSISISKTAVNGDFTVCAQVKDGQENEGAFVKGGSSLYAKLDNIAPTMTLARTDGATSTLTGAFDVTVTFNEDVTGFEAADVTVSPSTVTATKSVTGSGKAYTVTVSPASGTNQTLTIMIIANAVTDGATNANLVSASLSVPVNINVINTSAPTVTITGTPPAITTLNEGSYALDGTCSENTRDVEIYIGGTKRETITCASNAWSATLDLSSDADAEDTVAIFARHTNAGAAQVDSTSFTVTRDTKKPTVTIARTTGSAITPSKTATWTLSCNNDTCEYKSKVIAATDACTAISSGWSSTATVVTKPDGDGDFNVCVQAKDDQGNLGAFVKDATKKAKLDNTAPSVLSITREGSGTITTSFVAIVTFSEAVTVADFTINDVVVNNHASATNVVSTSSSVYKVTVTLSTIHGIYEKKIGVGINAGAVSDPAGNASTVASVTTYETGVINNVKKVTFNTPPPTITTKNKSSYRVSGTCMYVAGSGIRIKSELQSTTYGSDVNCDTNNGKWTKDNIDFGTTIATSVSSIRLAANYRIPCGGSHPCWINGDWQTIPVDLVVPTVTIAVPNSHGGLAFKVSFTFSEAVKGFSMSNITVSNGGGKVHLQQAAVVVMA